MFTCPALCHALQESRKNTGVHPKASKSMLQVERPDSSNYFNHQNDRGMIAFCCAVTARKLLTSPGVADTYTFLMNTWNTLPEIYQQRVYTNTLATVKRQIQQVEDPPPAVVISVEAVRIENAILLDYLPSEVVLEEPEIKITDTNILIDNNCADDKLQFSMPVGSGDYEDEGDESDDCDAIPTTSQRRWPTTKLERFDLGATDVNGYEGDDVDDAHADEEDEELQADNGSMQNLED